MSCNRLVRLFKHLGILLLFSVVFPTSLNAQSQGTVLISQPNFHILREMEDYSFLKNKGDYEADFFDPIKFIALNKKEDIYISFGGQIRSRYEYFINRHWTAEEDVDFYSQRLALHSDLSIGKYFRLFGEFYQGYTSHQKEVSQYDEFDIFQLYIEFKTQLSETNNISFYLGRQELPLGKSRLVGIREGPNIRRSFDMARLHINYNNFSIQAFYGKEVMPNIHTFDNTSNLFNSSAVNPSLWGVYAKFKIKNDIGKNELYYIGFHANIASFNDVMGQEIRQTLGVRRFGEIGDNLSYNTEFIYQFGTISDSDINAFSMATDAYYKLNAVKWKPQIGLKLEYSTGDQHKSDGKIQTFNPLFVNPAHYSLAGTVTPANLISIHPSIKANINNKLRIYAEWAMFWKNSSNDALYRPTRFVFIADNINENKIIGHQFGFVSSYNINRHLTFTLDFSYFFSGDFLEENNRNNNIFHFAPTINYKF